MNKSNTLYWKTATDPAERIEVRLVLNSYIDNDNLYVGLESRSKENPECWESYTDITVNLNSLPPFHAYVDNRDCNRHVHDFLTSNRIAEPAGFEYQGFRMFRFNPDRLKELAPEQFKTISAKNCSRHSRNISCFKQGTGRIPDRRSTEPGCCGI